MARFSGGNVPLFGRGRNPQDKEETTRPLLAEVNSQEFSLKLTYSAKSSEGVRLKGGPGMMDRLAHMLDGYAKTDAELVEPLPLGMITATPYIARLPGSAQWLQVHHGQSPITRHALVVLESVDAIDMVYENFVCALLDGETDTTGYPEYNAVFGGVVSHWDEMTGDMVARAVVGWGGKGVRGDTDRIAGQVLAGLFNNMAADSHAVGTVTVERQAHAAGPGSVACAHCGFSSGNDRAFYCPKCGMRMLRA
jgi:hypothetical protein